MIAHFMFLEREYGLRREDQSVAHEYVIVYSSNQLTVSVVFEMPDMPFVVIQKCDNQQIASEVFVRLAADACGRAPAVWARMREATSFGEWLRDLRTGRSITCSTNCFGAMPMPFARGGLRSLMGLLFARKRATLVIARTT